MHTTPEPAEQDLVASLVDAFPGYLRRRLEELGVAGDEALDIVVEQVASDLENELAVFAATPPHDQIESPLELVRRATSPVTTALFARGIAAPERDTRQADLHPDDVYELYPASSQDLSEEAWQAHLAWGVAKARIVAGVVPADQAPPQRPAAPTVALFGVEELRREMLTVELRRRGYDGLIWRNPAALERIESPMMVLVDIRHPNAHDAIRTLASRDVRVIAVADQVTDLVMPGLMALGAEEVLELSGVVAQLDRLLPRIV